MKLNLGDLRDWTKDVPDDYEVWIEYPERYGLHQPREIDTCCNDENDFIKATTMGRNEKKKRLYILHHY